MKLTIMSVFSAKTGGMFFLSVKELNATVVKKMCFRGRFFIPC